MNELFHLDTQEIKMMQTLLTAIDGEPRMIGQFKEPSIPELVALAGDSGTGTTSKRQRNSNCSRQLTVA